MENLEVIGQGLGLFGAGIGIMGAALGLGNLFSNWISSVARNPEAAPKFQLQGYLGLALTEALGLMAFVMGLLILFN